MTGAVGTKERKKFYFLMWAFDFGFNDGFDTLIFLQMGYRVLAVEANPSLYKEGLHKFGNTSKLTLKNIGIRENQKQQSFYTNLVNNEWSSFNPNVGCRRSLDRTDYNYCTEQRVETTSCATIMAMHTPHIVKLDFEGGEEYCLKYIARMRRKPRHIIVELNPRTRDEIPNLLGSTYTRYKVVPQYRLTHATSGPFGEFGIDCQFHKQNKWWEWRSASKPLNFSCPEEVGMWLDVHITMDTLVSV